LNISDLLLFFHFILFLLLFKDTIKLKLSNPFILGTLSLILCTVLSISFSSSVVTLVLILQWFLYYMLCTHFYNNGEAFFYALSKWGHAISLGSLLVIVSYFLGKPLILTSDVNFVEGFKDLKETATHFLRASYFVTSFIYVNACALITYFILLMFTDQRLVERLTTILLFVINLLCALLMQNKSELFAVLIIFSFIMCIVLDLHYFFFS